MRCGSPHSTDSIRGMFMITLTSYISKEHIKNS